MQKPLLTSSASLVLPRLSSCGTWCFLLLLLKGALVPEGRPIKHRHQEAFVTIFTHVALDSAAFNQSLNCPKRKNRTLDWPFASVSDTHTPPFPSLNPDWNQQNKLYFPSFEAYGGRCTIAHYGPAAPFSTSEDHGSQSAQVILQSWCQVSPWSTNHQSAASFLTVSAGLKAP